MSWLRLSQIAALVNGRLVGEDREVSGVFTDSRSPFAEGLFVALKGERFDAHEFIDAKLTAAGVMVSRPLRCEQACIEVDDTRAALGRLAANWRAGLAMPVIGLTGSNGKTTVKEMIAAILGQRGRVHATRGNLNNDIGLPLTLLELRPEHDYAVVEMGANHPGEIAYLTSLARPDVAVITNAGPAHLEGFGSIWGVSRAKGEIYAGLRDGGAALINADDDYAGYWTGLNAGRRVLRFSLGGEADISGRWTGEGRLQVRIPDAEVEIKLALLGRHNARNALAAIAVTVALGLDADAIRSGLESIRPVPGRLELKRGRGALRVIDDTYNANPASLSAAIEVLAEQAGRKLLVLGDMRELGEDARNLHAVAGEEAAKAGIDGLYAAGELSLAAVERFGAGARHFADVEALAAALSEEFGTDVSAPLTVLVKGSRGMRMERVVESLVADAGAASSNGERGHAA